MELKTGYALIWGDQTGGTCGSGGTVAVDVIYRGECVRTLVTCPCGRGCGNKAVVTDEWGYHDTDIEDIRADLPTAPPQKKRKDVTK